MSTDNSGGEAMKQGDVHWTVEIIKSHRFFWFPAYSASVGGARLIYIGPLCFRFFRGRR